VEKGFCVGENRKGGERILGKFLFMCQTLWEKEIWKVDARSEEWCFF